jgi:ketosteroid isomerase-like protein
VSAREPEECNGLLYAAIRRGDLEAAVAFYEPNATFVLDDGSVATGEAAIRDLLKSQIALKPDLGLELIEPLLSADGEIAVTGVAWHDRRVDAERTPVAESGRSLEVVRRQADGTWRIVIDHPHGRG